MQQIEPLKYGKFYHIYNRGINSCDLFHENTNYEYFLTLYDGGLFNRFGNFMNSEIIGEPTGSDYGIVFQRIDLVPRHPTQLYEAFSYLTIFLILHWVYSNQKVKRKDGYIFGLFLVL